MIQIVVEIVVFLFGILSVYYAKKENILVYPTGLIATGLTVYLLYKATYYADMLINLYFTIMSLYGWILWSKKDKDQVNNVLHITKCTIREKKVGLLFFLITIVVAFSIYNFFDIVLKIDNYIDILTSGVFFTAMWYMANKKIESWILWIIGNLVVVPIYLYKGLYILALQYFIFTILAIMAYIEWGRILKSNTKNLINEK